MPGVCGLAFAGVLALVMLLANGPALVAAPVTFAFEATVDSISPGASFDSAIDLEEGDVITGQFTFEPDPGDGSSSLVVNQPYNFTVNINGVELSTADYGATVRNDARISVDCPDLSCPNVFDLLELNGNSLSATNGNDAVLANLASKSSGFRLSLAANADSSLMDENFNPIPLVVVLEAAEIQADAGVWNQFSRRSLRVWLGDSQGDTFSLNATVGQFAVVPEPSSGSLVCLSIIMAGFAARAGRKFQKQR